MLTRELILSGSAGLPRETVRAFGGEVMVQGLTANERDEFESACLITDGKQQRVNVRGLRARLIALCVVDADGKRMFEPTDALQIGNLPAAEVARISDVAMRLSGLSDNDLGDLEKNSVSGPRV